MSDLDKPMRGMEAVLHMVFNPELDSMMSDFAEADRYAVVTHDPTTLYCGYIGPFDDLDSALAYRTRVETDLNKDMPEGEEPFSVQVVPMYSPEVPGA
jgi:hypothetical protein